MTSILDALGKTLAERLDPWLERRRFAAGTVIVREGDPASDMYFVVEGRARVRRADLDLGSVGPGEHFGELGLLAHRARAATIVAETDVLAARLDGVRYEAMLHEDPALAARFVRAVVDVLATKLTEMTDSVSRLLRERSLPRRASVEVRVAGERRTVATGSPLGAIVPPAIDRVPVVAAHLDGKAVSLSTPITSDATVAPLLASDWEGERVLRTSAALVLLEAVARLGGDVEVSLGASLGPAQWARLVAKDGAPVAGETWLAPVRAAVADLVGRGVALREEQWTVEEAIAHFREAGRAHAADLLAFAREPSVSLVACGGTYALGLGPVVPSAAMLADVRVEAADHGLVLLTGAGASPPERGTLWADAMAEHQRWLGSLGVDSVGAFNRACIDGHVKEIVRVAEGFHEKRLGRIADAIAARPGGVRVVCVAGPSSSGKTTFLKRLKIQLQVEGLVPIELSLDDYYVDRERTPRDASGKWDYEALEALDLALLRDHVRRLLAGERVRTARYDFLSGKSRPDGGKELALGPREILLVEGIHGLSPRLFEDALPRERCFRIFIQAMTSLPFDHLSRLNPSDLRLVRRIVRDRHGRGTSAEGNILRWPSVRAGERAHIFPSMGEADVVFDTSLVYEPSVLKTYAERYLLEVPKTSEAYATAIRLRRLFDEFVAIDHGHVPPTSILREFIGESGFEY